MRNLAATLLLLTGCQPIAGKTFDETATGGCEVDTECADGLRCVDGTCAGGCGGQAFELTAVAPNLMFVLDRSCSMQPRVNGTTKTRWEVAIDAITTLVGSYGDAVRWGLTMFPDVTGDACSQDAIPFPITSDGGSSVTNRLQQARAASDPLFPDGPCVTNIDTGMQQAARDPALSDPDRKSYVMLITDGAQSGCSTAGGVEGTRTIVSEMHARGIDSFIVGFGSGVNSKELDELATRGGTARTGETKYFKAETSSELDDALKSIAGSVATCTYRVDPAPPDPAQTYVWFEGMELVERDGADGWTYDAATQSIVFQGSACDRVRERDVNDIDVVFGCPSPPVL